MMCTFVLRIILVSTGDVGARKNVIRVDYMLTIN